MDKKKLPFNRECPFHAKWTKSLLLFALISFFSIPQSFAQRITRQYNNVSFSAALKDLNAHQKDYSINFVYDELEDFKVTKSIQKQTVPDAIMQLIGFYPIKMKVIDHIIIVECTQKSATKMMGRIVDSQHRPVDFANVALLNVNDSSFITGGVTNENSHSEMLDLNYRYHGLDVFSTLYYSLFQGYQDQHNETKAFGKTLMHVKEDLTIKDKSDYFSGSFGFNYVLNPSLT